MHARTHIRFTSFSMASIFCSSVMKEAAAAALPPPLLFPLLPWLLPWLADHVLLPWLLLTLPPLLLLAPSMAVGVPGKACSCAWMGWIVSE